MGEGGREASESDLPLPPRRWAGHHTVEEDTSTEQRLRRGPVHPLVEPFLKFVIDRPPRLGEVDVLCGGREGRRPPRVVHLVFDQS